MRDVSNPKVSKGFLLESYEKEVRVRLDWVFKHKEMLNLTTVFKGEPKNYEHTNIDHARVVTELEIIKRDHIVSTHRRNKAPAPTYSDLTLNYARKEEELKIPVDKPTKNMEYAQAVAGLVIIKMDHMTPRRRMKAPVGYTGVTANDIRKGDQVMRPIDKTTKELIAEGSKEYFKKRYQMNPEDKYYYPETTNWRYGWKLQDSSIRMNAPMYARVHLLSASAYPKVGLQPDPWYYGNPHQLSTR